MLMNVDRSKLTIPTLPLESKGVLNGKLVGGDYNVVPIRFGPPLSEFLSAFRGTVVTKHFHCWTKSLQLGLPIQNNRCRNNDKMRTPDSLISSQVSK